MRSRRISLSMLVSIRVRPSRSVNGGSFFLRNVWIVGNVLGLRNDWRLSATVVRPTAVKIAVPWWSYNQVFALWAPSSYNDAKAARPGQTYLDWLRTPELPA